ncbi:MAG: D-alanyl-D-alanine carboxypeptidase [Fimbriimonadales bacterium]|nr:D-alanyl-D-alanine carboxypeptidase [Fimbriimonadales bacterium]
MRCWSGVWLLGVGWLVASWANAPQLQARAAILMDAETRQVLYAKNAHQKLPPASLTKIMTAIVVLDRCDLDAVVTVSGRAARTKPSAIKLREGEQITVRDLLYALMLHSANDAAVALAEHAAGSVEAFTRLMNAKARAIGARHTRFMNPHGLHHPRHLSTAYDLALITRYAMQNETFRAIVRTPLYFMTRSASEEHLWVVNKAKFLSEYPYAEGVKTGYTRPAGFCFAGAASQDGRRLITIVLNSPQREADTIALMEHGFNDWVRMELAADAIVGRVRVENGSPPEASVRLAKTLCWVMPKAHQARYRWTIQPKSLCAPLRAGDAAGWLVVFRDERPLVRAQVLVAHDVAYASRWRGVIGWLTAGVLASGVLAWRRGRGRRPVHATRRIIRGY